MRFQIEAHLAIINKTNKFLETIATAIRKAVANNSIKINLQRLRCLSLKIIIRILEGAPTPLANYQPIRKRQAKIPSSKCNSNQPSSAGRTSSKERDSSTIKLIILWISRTKQILLKLRAHHLETLWTEAVALQTNKRISIRTTTTQTLITSRRKIKIRVERKCCLPWRRQTKDRA